MRGHEVWQKGADVSEETGTFILKAKERISSFLNIKKKVGTYLPDYMTPYARWLNIKSM